MERSPRINSHKNAVTGVMQEAPWVARVRGPCTEGSRRVRSGRHSHTFWTPTQSVIFALACYSLASPSRLAFLLFTPGSSESQIYCWPNAFALRGVTLLQCSITIFPLDTCLPPRNFTFLSESQYGPNRVMCHTLAYPAVSGMKDHVDFGWSLTHPEQQTWWEAMTGMSQSRNNPPLFTLGSRLNWESRACSSLVVLASNFSQLEFQVQAVE